ncbi:MAG: PilT/PilU family type 4a pilus ATPase [Acidobacteria bacterium]|nr:PilT/PilU family type 4a pilus ATPase [Acidobacteriota bacterium]
MLAYAPNISDLNFSVGRAPLVEVNGELIEVPIRGLSRLSPYQTEQIALHLMHNDKLLIRKLLKQGSADLSYSIPGKTRFRVNIFSQRGTYSIVLRVIPNGVPTVEELGLPKVVNEIAEERNGIVLLTGPTGSGKSTTLAAIINRISENKAYHIVTIEDPIEYLHRHKKSTINQRELGADVPSFALALRAALRQAPKVILVGEMRDLETTEIALEAAETGHLVLSTLHTIDASKTIDRIIGIFPKDEEQQIRTRFGQTFKWIVSQRLVPKPDGSGRLAICEILKSTQRTREYVIKGESEKEGRSLLDAMNDGALDGMQTFDMELERLWRNGVLSKETALSYATNAPNLALKMSGIAGASAEGGGPGAATQTENGSKASQPLAGKKRLGAFAGMESPMEKPKAPPKLEEADPFGQVDIKDLME